MLQLKFEAAASVVPVVVGGSSPPHFEILRTWFRLLRPIQPSLEIDTLNLLPTAPTYLGLCPRQLLIQQHWHRQNILLAGVVEVDTLVSFVVPFKENGWVKAQSSLLGRCRLIEVCILSSQ